MTLSKLQPNDLWKNFEDICSLPHPSKHEDKIREFVVKFGKDLGLETIVDGVGNVIIRKPATPGFENRVGVVLQGHIDMVPQKNSDTKHDFENDPINAYIDGEWVTAEGTTLGADNGIGCAAAMAVLQSKSIQHGPVEALFTIDEETGMTGAFGLKPGILQGGILLNLDSEDEGELYIGCAGGMDANINYPYTKENAPASFKTFKLLLTGLKGGHSGLDIILGRGNANKLMIRFLKDCKKETGLRLAEMTGGSLRNAIPREAFAIVMVDNSKADRFLEMVKEYENLFKFELSAVEPGLSFIAEAASQSSHVIPETVEDKLIYTAYSIPNGVYRMSDAMPEIVETSNNLAIIKAADGKIEINCLMRSSVDSAKNDIANMIDSICKLSGFNVVFEGEYPGWKPNIDSPILKTMKETYHKMHGKTPEVKVIHAGLECGILGAAYPSWDMISFGPTIRFPHSPDEKVNIPTVLKFWDFLVETLKNIPTK